MTGTPKPGSVRMLLIDNYDSFTYNLVQAFAAMGAEVLVYRNDEITVEEARALSPTHLVISPGPGRPDDAGVSLAMIGAFAASCRCSACVSATSASCSISAARSCARNA